MNVSEIKNGIIIDHIRCGKGLRILELIDLDRKVAVLLNVESKKMGKKDLIKISNGHLSKKHLTWIAAISPSCTLNVVKDGKLVEKRTLKRPTMIEEILICPNPTCITNQEQDARTCFHLTKDNMFKCAYCQRVFSDQQLKLRR